MNIYIQKKIQHRDLKTQNILVKRRNDNTYELLITDLGTAIYK